MKYHEKDKSVDLLEKYLIKVEKQMPNILKQIEEYCNARPSYDEDNHKKSYHSTMKLKYDDCKKDYSKSTGKADQFGKYDYCISKSMHNDKKDFYGPKQKFDGYEKHDYYDMKPMYYDYEKSDYYDIKQKYGDCDYDKKSACIALDKKDYNTMKSKHNNHCHNKDAYPCKSYDFYKKNIKKEMPYPCIKIIIIQDR